ncbi:MAG: 2-hydroxyacid dehydrogenase [Propionibacteriaceae bacterium]
MSNPLTVVCLSDYPHALVSEWASAAGTNRPVEVVLARRDQTVADLADDLARAHVVIGDAARRFPLTAAVINSLAHCRDLIQPSVGLDGVVDTAAARERGIRVTNAPGYNADAVADWTVMAMLITLRGAVRADRELRRGDWPQPPLGRELGAVTVGLIGYGAIGQAVHRRLRGFGTRVLCHTPHPPVGADAPSFVSLDTLLADSDAVSLHAPLTERTRAMISSDRLARMRTGSVLVNASRGALVDEAALVTALTDGHLAAAALDVFATEPLPADSPLRDLPQVFLTPHLAAGTEQARVRVRRLVADALATALRDLDDQVEVPR